MPARRQLTRRDLLGMLGLAGVATVTGCGSSSTSTAASRTSITASPSDLAPITRATPTRTAATRKSSMQTIRYGTDASQFGDLYLPAGSGSVPVVVVVHGGYWSSSYGNELGTPLAQDLVTRGVAAWNIEYRRLGIGGGWPGTFEDTAAAMDALAGKVNDAAGGRLDVANVVVVGHSAGGQIAGWLAGRHTLKAGQLGASPLVSPVGYVAQAGVLDLVSAFDQDLGGGAVAALMGGSPTKFPERYANGSPYALLPYGIPGTLVHGLDDQVVPIQQSDTFAAKAHKVGDHVTEIRLPGVDHFMLIDPSTPAWAACRTAALGYLRLR